VQEQIEDLRFDVHRFGATAELAALRIESEVIEQKAHLPSSIGPPTGQPPRLSGKNG
jgi:hypothetical protein